MSPPGRRDLWAAAWWSRSLGRRPSLLGALAPWRTPLALGSAGLALGGCAEVFSQQEETEPGRAALEQQEQAGWNVGGEGRPLAFPDSQSNDVSGSDGWRDALTSLTARLAPANPRWAPSYNPTLFQSLESWRNADLRAAIRPIFTADMALAARRGEALLSLLQRDGGCRDDVAVVLDVPGPESVAVAAALAPCFDPVFVLGNWPHPLGVVPAHLTLGSALYYLPSFERARARRAGGAPPVFVLDRQRMSPYVDDADRFDNRYLVGLPDREVLQAAGLRRILYVTPDERVSLEADDLNDDLVAAAEGGMDVKLLALSDFAETPLPDWPTPPPCGPGGTAPAGALGVAPLYFGGSPGAHGCFAAWYGWQPAEPTPLGSLTLSVNPSPPPPPPHRLLPRCHYHPTPRLGGSLAAHSGHPGGGWHALAGWHSGALLGRSGSFGRAHGGFSG